MFQQSLFPCWHKSSNLYGRSRRSLEFIRFLFEKLLSGLLSETLSGALSGPFIWDCPEFSIRAPSFGWVQTQAPIETLGWHVGQNYTQDRWRPHLQNLRQSSRSAQSLNMRLAIRRPAIITAHAQFAISFGPTSYLTAYMLNSWTSAIHNLSPNFSADRNYALYVKHRAQFASTRDYVSFAQFGAEFEPNSGRTLIPPCLRC